MNDSTLNTVRKDRNVHFVEAEQTFSVQLHDSPTFEAEEEHRYNSTVAYHSKREAPVHFGKPSSERLAPFNLRMVGAGTKLPTPVANLQGTYEYVKQAGQGVDVYIMDTGIQISNEGFGGRAVNFEGLGPKAQSPYARPPALMDDLDGHGTEVAGIAGSKRYGVAKQATLINVKVVTDRGWRSDSNISNKLLVKAINAIIGKHQSSRKNDPTGQFRGSVVNMSFIAYKGRPGQLATRAGFKAFQWACKRARKQGITLVAAAPNQKRPLTSDDVPCVLDSVICVASVDNSYVTTDLTPWGTQLAFYAPGQDVETLSTDTPYTTVDGNSFVAPHVAGMAAIFTSWKGLATGGAETYIYWNSIPNIVSPLPPSDDSGCAQTGEIIYNNSFATTGIQNSHKSGGEPFMYGGDVRPTPIRKGKTVPIKGWKEVPKNA